MLAVTGKRLPSLPDVPTTAEAGYPKGRCHFLVCGVCPAGVPQGRGGQADSGHPHRGAKPHLPAKGAGAGATADYQTPAQLGDKVRADLANWATVVKTSKIGGGISIKMACKRLLDKRCKL